MTEKPYLILMVGLPRSGKSTWAKQSGFPIVSPDAIRLALHGKRFDAVMEPEVWEAARLMVRSLFGAGNPIVVLDACNATEKRRAEWVSPEWECFCVQFAPDVPVCIERARADGRDELIPVIERMAAAFEPLPEANFATLDSFIEKVQAKWGRE